MKFTTLNKNDIHQIKPLWEKLNLIHLNESNFFKEHYQKFTFEERCKRFEKIDQDDLRIETVSVNNTPVGYCISSYSEWTGEIDSLFVDEAFRSRGLGKTLVTNALAWFELKKCSNVVVSVAEGHESVLPFYRQFNFFPRMFTLQRRKC